MYLYEYHLFNSVNLQISSRLCFWFYSILWKNMQCCSVEYNITNSSWQFRQNVSFWTGRSLQTYYMDLSFALVQFSFLERLTGQYQGVCRIFKYNVNIIQCMFWASMICKYLSVLSVFDETEVLITYIYTAKTSGLG